MRGHSEKATYPPPLRYFLWLVSHCGWFCGERASRMTLHLLNSRPAVLQQASH